MQPMLKKMGNQYPESDLKTKTNETVVGIYSLSMVQSNNFVYAITDFVVSNENIGDTYFHLELQKLKCPGYVYSNNSVMLEYVLD